MPSQSFPSFAITNYVFCFVVLSLIVCICIYLARQRKISAKLDKGEGGVLTLIVFISFIGVLIFLKYLRVFYLVHIFLFARSEKEKNYDLNIDKIKISKYNIIFNLFFAFLDSYPRIITNIVI
jgi:hypothetical protein